MKLLVNRDLRFGYSASFVFAQSTDWRSVSVNMSTSYQAHAKQLPLTLQRRLIRPVAPRVVVLSKQFPFRCYNPLIRQKQEVDMQHLKSSLLLELSAGPLSSTACSHSSSKLLSLTYYVGAVGGACAAACAESGLHGWNRSTLVWEAR